MSEANPTPAVWSVACPRCGSMPGKPCRYPNGDQRASHEARRAVYLCKPELHATNSHLFTTKGKS